MKKAITTIIFIWFAISFTYLFVTGTVLDWNSYVTRLTESIPNFNSVFTNIMDDWNNLYILFGNIGNNYGWLADTAIAIANVLKLITDLLLVPIKVLYYLYKVITAFIPYFNV